MLKKNEFILHILRFILDISWVHTSKYMWIGDFIDWIACSNVCDRFMLKNWWFYDQNF